MRQKSPGDVPGVAGDGTGEEGEGTDPGSLTWNSDAGVGQAGRSKGDPTQHNSKIAKVSGGEVCPGGSVGFHSSLHTL